MRPIDMVLFDGDSRPSTPVNDVANAMAEDLVVRGPRGQMRILSYYYCDLQQRMILEVEE